MTVRGSTTNAIDMTNIWWNFEFRHVAYSVRRLKESSAEERHSYEKLLVQEIEFLLKKSVDPGFYRFLHRELNKPEWVKRHVKEIGYLVLLDLLHPEQATVKEAETLTKGVSEELITRRQRQRIIYEYYPEIFFSPSEKKIRDTRRAPFKSIFSVDIRDLPEWEEKETYDALVLMTIQDLALTGSLQKSDSILELHANLRLVDPEDIADLPQFWKDLKKTIEFFESHKKYSIPKEAEWLVDHIKKRGAVVEVLYRLILDAVSFRWFKLKTEKQRDLLLHRNYRLRYTNDDAKRAVSENLRWFEDPRIVADYISRGAGAYLQIGKPSISLNLYSEVLKQVSMDKIDEALCHHNMAHCYRNLKRPRRMLIELQTAMKIWEKTESNKDIAITWSHISEAYRLLGNDERAKRALKNSKDILFDRGLRPEEITEAFLEMADCAQRVQDVTWERTALESGLDSALEIEGDTYLFLYLNQRLLDLNMGRSTYIAELEPGKLRHPPTFATFRPSPFMFIPIAPTSEDSKNDAHRDEKKSQGGENREQRS